MHELYGNTIGGMNFRVHVSNVYHDVPRQRVKVFTIRCIDRLKAALKQPIQKRFLQNIMAAHVKNLQEKKTDRKFILQAWHRERKREGERERERERDR